MKRARAAFIVAAIAAALAVPASALAYTDTGRVEFDTGLICKGCVVTIHNITTGANGSTTSNSQGYWSAGGFVSGYTYQVWATYYLSPGCTYAHRNFMQWTQGSSNKTIDPLSVYSTAIQSGCPILWG